MKNKALQSLAADLSFLIDRRAKEIAGEDSTWKDRYTYLTCELKNIISAAKANKQEFKKLGLTANSIENEGYLRCALTVEGIIKDSENW